jgi:mannitol-1-/sugar-/sorbitol-6-/2-deoxyglucose-6-phosphatase
MMCVSLVSGFNMDSIRQHIFDMDGLLIDSEPYWRAAEVKVFNLYDVPFTEDMCRETVGMRIDEVVRFWAITYPSITSKVDTIANDIQDELISLIKKEGKALPGVYTTLEMLKMNKRNCALASSSSMRIINEVVQALHIKEFFTVIHSAEFEEKGKPHPDVFLSTASMMNTQPTNCVVYEDSRNGLLAALAAKMKTVLIPEFPFEKHEWFLQAHKKLNSMEEFDLAEIELL